MGKSTISMAIFHCYVSSPEGKWEKAPSLLAGFGHGLQLSKKMQEVYPTGAPIRTTDIDLAKMGIERLLLFESGWFSVKILSVYSLVLAAKKSKSLLFPKYFQVSCTVLIDSLDKQLPSGELT